LNAFNTNRSLTQPKKIHQVIGNTFLCFYSVVTDSVELNRQDFCPVCNFLSAQPFQLCSLFLILVYHSVSFPLKELILSVQGRIFSFFPCIILLRVFKAWEMSARKATLLHQVSLLNRSASSD
jgi:hypothetical protein